MPEKEPKKNNFQKIIIWGVIIISLVVITESFIKYYINKDFLLVDKIPCLNNEKNCFTPDNEGEDPYKVLIFDESINLNCTEKDTSCDIDNICGNSSSDKCKIIGCNNNLNIIPKGYTTSGECLVEKII